MTWHARAQSTAGALEMRSSNGREKGQMVIAIALPRLNDLVRSVTPLFYDFDGLFLYRFST